MSYMFLFFTSVFQVPPFPEDICYYIVALELSGSATLPKSWKDSKFQQGLQEPPERLYF